MELTSACFHNKVVYEMACMLKYITLFTLGFGKSPRKCQILFAVKRLLFLYRDASKSSFRYNSSKGRFATSLKSYEMSVLFTFNKFSSCNHILFTRNSSGHI